MTNMLLSQDSKTLPWMMQYIFRDISQVYFVAKIAITRMPSSNSQWVERLVNNGVHCSLALTADR